MPLTPLNDRIITPLAAKGREHERELLISARKLDDNIIKISLNIVIDGHEFDPISSRSILCIVNGNSIDLKEVFN